MSSILITCSILFYNNLKIVLFLKIGEVAKWLNAADCNSVPFGSAVRICPSPPLESNTTCKSCVFFNLYLDIYRFFVKMVDGILCLTSFHFLIEGGV